MFSCKEFIEQFVRRSRELGECKSSLFLSQLENGNTSENDCDKIENEINNFFAESTNNGATEEAQQRLKDIRNDAEYGGYTAHRDKQQRDPLPYMRGQLFASIMQPLRKSREDTYCSLMAESESPKI